MVLRTSLSLKIELQLQKEETILPFGPGVWGFGSSKRAVPENLHQPKLGWKAFQQLGTKKSCSQRHHLCKASPGLTHVSYWILPCNSHSKGTKKHRPLKPALQRRGSRSPFAPLFLISGQGGTLLPLLYPLLHKWGPPSSLPTALISLQNLPLFFLLVIHGHCWQGAKRGGKTPVLWLRIPSQPCSPSLCSAEISIQKC